MPWWVSTRPGSTTPGPSGAASSAHGGSTRVGVSRCPGAGAVTGRCGPGPARQPHESRRLRQPGLHRHEGEQRLAAVRRDDAVYPQRRVGMVGAHGPPGVDQAPHTLDQCDPFRELGQLGLRHRREVELHAEVAEQRRACGKGDGMRAVGRVRVRGSDVSAEQLRRDEQGGPPLDLLPFERVVAVAGPDAVGPFEDAEVDAATAAGALSISTPG